MGIHERVESFAGKRVLDYDPDRGIADPSGSAVRLSVSYDTRGTRTFPALLARFLDDPGSRHAEALVVGAWWDAGGGYGSASAVVAALAEARDRLPALRALFLGDILGEECEISWIEQSDVTPLLEAYPALETLKTRGGNGLRLVPLEHHGLRSLIAESGGLPGEFVRAVAACRFPNLEHLELWLGEDGYGGTTTVDDLAPILRGEAFPRLRSLGLRDSEMADQVAAALANAPILDRLEVLDLSLGVLSDEGALALLSGGRLGHLRRLDIHHHYVSDEVLDELKALSIELDADDHQEPDDWGDGEEHRYIAVSE